MPKVAFGARIEEALVQKIEARAQETHRSKTDVVEELMQIGLAKLEDLEAAEGFALLGDPEMQDMTFPTGAQRETMNVAD